MFRPTLPIFALLCLIAVTVSAAPAAAQPQGPIVINPAFLIRTVTVIGAGETTSQALDNALYEIRKTYFVLGYSTANPICSDVGPVPFCSIEVTASVIRKAFWVKD